MTKRLYDIDSHQIQTESVVLTCDFVDGGFDVTLDQTVFFPEGGGQPSDTGTLGDAIVSDVQEKNGEIFNRVDRALRVGDSVKGTIDWVRRFDLMAKTPASTLLSFAFYDLFGASNIGFHLALDYATIDFDKPLSPEQVTQAELLANRFIWRNLPVQASVLRERGGGQKPAAQEACRGLDSPIRIVSVEGADMCTRCAPHCHLTGEIGRIFVPTRSATRAVCASRSFAASAHSGSIAPSTKISIHLRYSCQREGVLNAIRKLFDDYSAPQKERAGTSPARSMAMSRTFGAPRCLDRFSQPHHVFRAFTPRVSPCAAQSKKWSGYVFRFRWL